MTSLIKYSGSRCGINSELSDFSAKVSTTMLGPWGSEEDQIRYSLPSPIILDKVKLVSLDKSKKQTKLTKNKSGNVRNLIKRSLKSQLSQYSNKRLPLIMIRIASKKQVVLNASQTKTLKHELPIVRNKRIKTQQTSIETSKSGHSKGKKMYFFRELNILKALKPSKCVQASQKRSANKKFISLTPLNVKL